MYSQGTYGLLSHGFSSDSNPLFKIIIDINNSWLKGTKKVLYWSQMISSPHKCSGNDEDKQFNGPVMFVITCH
jgi:hypothetical protein